VTIAKVVKFAAECNTEFESLASHLIVPARGIKGKFIIARLGEDPKTDAKLRPDFWSVPNSGPPNQIVAALMSLAAVQERGRNISVGPWLMCEDLAEDLKGGENDIEAMLAIVLDFDRDHDPQTRHERLPVPAHAEVETSPGNFHDWLFFDRAYPWTEVKPVLEVLVDKVGCDHACKDTSHVYRVPSTWNWPTKKKRDEGRPADPVLARLTKCPDDWLDEGNDRISLADLKGAMIAKWGPNIFTEAKERAKAAENFDWDRRETDEFNPFNASEIRKILDKPEYAKDRSGGAYYFIQRMKGRGYTPNAIMAAMQEHADTIVMGHYTGTDGAVDERRLASDVERCFLKGDREDSATPQWVARLNVQYALVKHGSKAVVADFTSGELISFMESAAFEKLYVNRWAPKAHEEDAAQPLGKAWFRHASRRQYLRGVVFDPGKPIEPTAGVLNLWRGYGVQPKAGNWSLMREHIRQIICAGDKARFGWTMGWMACGAQRMGVPLGVALALRGIPGAGKGIFARWFGKIFAPHFLHLNNPRELIGRFNAGLGTSVCVFLDEAVFAGDRAIEGELKALVTEPTVRIEEKFLSPFTAQNRLRLVLSTNDKWVVPVGIEDRRFAVFDVLRTRKGDYPYFDAITAQMENGGAEAMLYDLLRYDLSRFEVRDIPTTEARTDQMIFSLKGPLKWLYSVLQDGSLGHEEWADKEVAISRDGTYDHYVKFSQLHREYEPTIKDVWSKEIRKALSGCVRDTRPTQEGRRLPLLVFRPLEECRKGFAEHLKSPIVWEAVKPD
jgi:hypothetical protein